MAEISENQIVAAIHHPDDPVGAVKALLAQAWDEAIESTYLCENHPPYMAHIDYDPNPYKA